MRLRTITESLIAEAVVTVPDIPNTRSFWHGGNLDDYDETIAQKNGRYEYGPGLYITTHHGTAQKYAKGSRKMYMITVENGTDINDSKIDLDTLNGFVDEYVIGSKKKEIKKRLAEYAKDGKVKAYLFNNMMVNEKAVKSSNTKAWREFLVSQGIDYEMVNSPFGWGEKMMVLYNMKKIKKVQQIKPGDKIEDYDMLMESTDDESSAEFNDKFNAWFDGSKVVDGSGEPLICYHGTKSIIKEFRPSKSVGNQGETDQLEGIYFTDDKDGASFFALVDDDPRYLMPVYLSIKNPYVVADYKTLKADLGVEKMAGVAKKLKELGHDGIIMKKGFQAQGTFKLFLAFEPNQVKSVNNDGSWDANDNNIYS